MNPEILKLLGTAAVGALLSSFVSTEPNKPEPWADKNVFNTRLKELHGLFLALNDGLSKCPAFMKNAALLGSWRATRDSFGRFYGDVGTKVYLAPKDSEIEQAKEYASKLYFWNGEYSRLCGGGNIVPKPPAPVAPTTPTDWVGVAKWSAIGIGGLIVAKTLHDVFRRYP